MHHAGSAGRRVSFACHYAPARRLKTQDGIKLIVNKLTLRRVSGHAFWFTAVGPLFGLVACTLMVGIMNGTLFGAVQIFTEKPLMTVLLTYLSGGPAALLTGIFAAFIRRGPHRPYVVIPFGALISLLLPFFFGITELDEDRSLMFFLYAFSGAFASICALLTLKYRPFQMRTESDVYISNNEEKQ